MDNPRFNQLLDLAREGDEASVAQLWHEFGFDFHDKVPCPERGSGIPAADSLISENQCESVVKKSLAEGGESC